MCTEHAYTYHSAFKERHPVNVAFYLLPKLLLQAFPCVPYIMHLQRTHQLQSGVTLHTTQTSYVKCTDTFRPEVLELNTCFIIAGL